MGEKGKAEKTKLYVVTACLVNLQIFSLSGHHCLFWIPDPTVGTIITAAVYLTYGVLILIGIVLSALYIQNCIRYYYISPFFSGEAQNSGGLPRVTSQPVSGRVLIWTQESNSRVSASIPSIVSWRTFLFYYSTESFCAHIFASFSLTYQNFMIFLKYWATFNSICN